MGFVTRTFAYIGVAALIAGGGFYGGYKWNEARRPDVVESKTVEDYKLGAKLAFEGLSTELVKIDWSRMIASKTTSKTTRTILEKPTGEKVTTEVTDTVNTTDINEGSKVTEDTTVAVKGVEEITEGVTKTNDLSITKKDDKWALTIGLEHDVREAIKLEFVPVASAALSYNFWGPLSAGAAVTSEKTGFVFVEAEFGF
jgi:hypothetical protein